MCTCPPKPIQPELSEPEEPITDSEIVGKLRPIVDAWFNELPLYNTNVLSQLLEWDKKINTLIDNIVEIIKEPNHEIILRDKIVEWLKTFNFLPGQDTLIPEFANELIKKINDVQDALAVDKTIKPVEKASAPSNEIFSKEDKDFDTLTKITSNNSRDTIEVVSEKLKANNENESKKNSDEQELNTISKLNTKLRLNRRTADIIEDTVWNWCNRIPIQPLIDYKNNQILKKELVTKIMNKIKELNNDPALLQDDILYDILLGGALEKYLSELPQSELLLEIKDTIKYELKESLRAVKPLIINDKVVSWCKSNKKASIEAISPNNETDSSLKSSIDTNMISESNSDVIVTTIHKNKSSPVSNVFVSLGTSEPNSSGHQNQQSNAPQPKPGNNQQFVSLDQTCGTCDNCLSQPSPAQQRPRFVMPPGAQRGPNLLRSVSPAMASSDMADMWDDSQVEVFEGGGGCNPRCAAVPRMDANPVGPPMMPRVPFTERQAPSGYSYARVPEESFSAELDRRQFSDSSDPLINTGGHATPHTVDNYEEFADYLYAHSSRPSGEYKQRWVPPYARNYSPYGYGNMPADYSMNYTPPLPPGYSYSVGQSLQQSFPQYAPPPLPPVVLNFPPTPRNSGNYVSSDETSSSSRRSGFHGRPPLPRVPLNFPRAARNNANFVSLDETRMSSNSRLGSHVPRPLPRVALKFPQSARNNANFVSLDETRMSHNRSGSHYRPEMVAQPLHGIPAQHLTQPPPEMYGGKDYRMESHYTPSIPPSVGVQSVISIPPNNTSASRFIASESQINANQERPNSSKMASQIKEQRAPTYTSIRQQTSNVSAVSGQNTSANPRNATAMQQQQQNFPEVRQTATGTSRSTPHFQTQTEEPISPRRSRWRTNEKDCLCLPAPRGHCMYGGHPPLPMRLLDYCDSAEDVFMPCHIKRPCGY